MARHRRPPKTTNDAHSQEPRNQVPTRSHEVIRLHTQRHGRPRGADPCRDCTIGRQSAAGEDYRLAPRRATDMMYPRRTVSIPLAHVYPANDYEEMYTSSCISQNV